MTKTFRDMDGLAWLRILFTEVLVFLSIFSNLDMAVRLIAGLVGIAVGVMTFIKLYRENKIKKMEQRRLERDEQFK